MVMINVNQIVLLLYHIASNDWLLVKHIRAVDAVAYVIHTDVRKKL